MLDAEEIVEKQTVIFEELMGLGGSVGVMTLNRPEALNALTMEMCRAIDQKLAQWQQMGSIKAVVIQSLDDKAFCAGGDVRYVYEQAKSGIKKSREFFWHEYRMNHRIYHFNKPYIALMHGLTMGGGAGVSVHGTHRVAAENLIFAMPETGIGFFPDVGASYFLPRCPGKVGNYIALTGARLQIADALYAGMVDHLVPKESFESLIGAITETRFGSNPCMEVSDIINAFSIDADGMEVAKPYLLERRNEINHFFSANSIERLLTDLSESDLSWCQDTLTTLLRKSPTSLKVTLQALVEGKQMDFDNCLKMESRIANRFLEGHDFYEGIRAAIVAKDYEPSWQPNNLEEVTPEIVASYFEPLSQELEFDGEVS
jgi:enoyl-CoA hydratase